MRKSDSSNSNNNGNRKNGGLDLWDKDHPDFEELLGSAFYSNAFLTIKRFYFFSRYLQCGVGEFYDPNLFHH
eukprot:TCALIF_00041-PA protein Name:"Protein of unknown function" AED:0.99 eAED:1.00 QI:0/0/0/0.5/1/1/2/0/71